MQNRGKYFQLFRAVLLINFENVQPFEFFFLLERIQQPLLNTNLNARFCINKTTIFFANPDVRILLVEVLLSDKLFVGRAYQPLLTLLAQRKTKIRLFVSSKSGLF